MSHHRDTRLTQDDHFARGQITVFAVLVVIAAVAALLRVVGMLH